MADSPEVNSDWHSSHIIENSSIFRPEQPEKFVVPPKINFSLHSYRTEKERINATIKQNESIFGFPSSTSSAALHNFRPRNPEKEIHGDLRFTYSTAIERIRDQIKNSSSNYIGSKKLSKRDMAISNHPSEVYSGFYGNRPILSSEVAKELYPELSKKTHFKAAVSLQLKLPDSLKGNEPVPSIKSSSSTINLQKSKENLGGAEEENLLGRGLPPINKSAENLNSQMSPKRKEARNGAGLGGTFEDEVEMRENSREQTENQETRMKKKQSKNELHEHALPTSIVKDTLIRCNYIKKPNENVPRIHPGDGIFFGDPNLKHRDVYNSILMKKKS